LTGDMVWSQPIGHDGTRMRFDSKRTPMGEAVFRLKNRGGPAGDLIETAVDFVRRTWSGRVDCVVWPPPSVPRFRQPAAVLATGIAEALGVTTEPNAVRKVRVTNQLKNLPIYERAAIIEQAIQPGSADLAGRRVLVVDDLWQSGSTMRRVAEVIGSMEATTVLALAMTRTR
jgi:predicted amidophosphoribosyltransferase